MPQTTFSRIIIVVTAPTPPGTGVMDPAKRAASSKATSPTVLPSTRFDADVDDDSAGFYHIAGNEACPTGRCHDDIGLWQTALRSFVRL